MDINGSTGFTHYVQLVVDAEAGVGTSGCDGGAELILVVHSAELASIYFKRNM